MRALGDPVERRIDGLDRRDFSNPDRSRQFESADVSDDALS
jgi:hypothetical protein